MSDTVTEQLTDSSVREFVVTGLLPEVDYTVAVRGYYELLGPAKTTTVRLEGISNMQACILLMHFEEISFIALDEHIDYIMVG